MKKYLFSLILLLYPSQFGFQVGGQDATLRRASSTSQASSPQANALENQNPKGINFNCLASDFYEGYVETATQRFPISVSKGLMSASEIVRHFAGKKVHYIKRSGIVALIIDQSDPRDPVIYSAILVDGKSLMLGTKSSDLQKLFEEKATTLTYHFNRQSIDVGPKDESLLY
ncbi:MAG: hypothetical protein HYV97_18250 [Bdellovibrio sp.]|nr:hypothetical protein [Bdellovibrio sp.]